MDTTSHNESRSLSGHEKKKHLIDFKLLKTAVKIIQVFFKLTFNKKVYGSPFPPLKIILK